LESKKVFRFSCLPDLGIEKALEEISQNKGILYDPEIVDICLKLFKEKGFKFE